MSPSPTRDIEQGKRDLDRFGYAIHLDALTPGQTAKLRERLQEQAALELEHGLGAFGLAGFSSELTIGTPPPGVVPAYQQVPFLPVKGAVFRDLLNLPIAHAYVEHALQGVHYCLATMAGLIVRNGAAEMVTHIDQQPIPFATGRPTGLNIMFCLSDFEEDMGATRFAPGSHLGPPPELQFDGDGRALPIGREMVAAVAPAGSAILFESRVWHTQGASTSDKVRYSVGTNYVMHFLKPAENYPASLPDDVYLALDGLQKRMLGFEAVYGYGGRIAPRSPSDPRRNTNEHRPFVPELRRTE
jgi:hypothetical protein